MSRSRVPRSMLCKSMALGFLLVLLGAPSWGATAKTETFATDHLKVRNLIGEVRIEGHGGSEFEVVVQVQGRDAADGRIRIESGDDRLDVIFPADQTDYVYPPLGQRSKSEFKIGDSGWLSDLLGGRTGSGRIRVRGSGDGLELWVDLTVRVPSGGSLELEHGVGAVAAANVDGELDLSTRSGDVAVESSTGELSVATGSGRVALTRIDGEEVSVATGSGQVIADDCEGDRFEFATGSGRVDLVAVRGRSIQVGTGSGNIKVEELEADSVEIGAGSGDITVALSRMGEGEYEVGTGSGDIALTMPRGASAEVHAETSSGEITVDLAEQPQYSKREKDEVRLTVGSGSPSARVDLGSGSGDIRIRS